MSNLESNLTLPLNCISYYASNKSKVDNKDSYEFWMRGKCVRLICNKSFARGDVLQLNNIKETNTGIAIDTTLIDEWQEEYPVLNFISGRLVYNKWAEFECTPSEGIQIIQPLYQILQDSLSIGFITLVYKSGKITCIDKITQNKFDVFIGLEWE